MAEMYLDNAATTRPYKEVVEAITDAMGNSFGNASSLHRRGVRAEQLVYEAKDHIKRLVGTSGFDVLFTSGGTEANNLALLSSAPKGKRNTIVTTSIEHASVIDCATQMAQNGCTLKVINAGRSGVLTPADFLKQVDDKTALVSIIHVANEMGTVQPINAIAKAVKQKFKRVKIHVDAVQAAAQLPRLDYAPEVDLVTISSHKIHGPQGVGVLLHRTGTAIKPLFAGGDQQREMRPGTLNLPGIVGMGIAAHLTAQKRPQSVPNMKALTDEFEALICQNGVYSLGDNSARAPGILIVAAPNVKSEILLHTLEKYDVLASSGSACHSSRTEPPACLVDAGLKSTDGVIRFSLSYDTTREQLETAAHYFHIAVNEVQKGEAG